jgi:site-specific DNA-cytosine methylase
VWRTIEGGRRGEFSELHDLDIVTSGVPCPHCSNAGSMTSSYGKARREAGTERHLFRRQVQWFEIFRPRAALIEQPAPTSRHLHEYTKLTEGMQRCGYHCQARILNCAEHGDFTSRRRWFLVCLRHNGAIEWPTPRTTFEGLALVLDPPKTVCLSRIVPVSLEDDYVRRTPRSPLGSGSSGGSEAGLLSGSRGC